MVDHSELTKKFWITLTFHQLEAARYDNMWKYGINPPKDAPILTDQVGSKVLLKSFDVGICISHLVLFVKIASAMI